MLDDLPWGRGDETPTHMGKRGQMRPHDPETPPRFITLGFYKMYFDIGTAFGIFHVLPLKNLNRKKLIPSSGREQDASKLLWATNRLGSLFPPQLQSKGL